LSQNSVQFLCAGLPQSRRGNNGRRDGTFFIPTLALK
jgi:hypothetical protein